MEAIVVIRALHVIFGLVTITVMLISLRRNNKTMAMARIILSAIMVFISLLSDVNIVFVVAWALITILMIQLAGMRRDE